MGKRVILIAGVLGCCILSAGCPIVQETACERALGHMFECSMDGMDGMEEEVLGAGGIDAYISMVCRLTTQMADCNWTAYAACVMPLSCDELLTGAGDACQDELDLENCMPFGGY